MASINVKKCRQHSQDYFKFRFQPSFTLETMLIYLLGKNIFSTDAIKPVKIKDFLKIFSVMMP